MNGTRQTVVLALLGILMAGGAWGQTSFPADSVVAVNGLQGLRDAFVVIEVLDPEGAQRTGLTREGLETTLRAALLRSNTIRLLSSEQARATYVYLTVFLMPMGGGHSTMYSVDLRLRDAVILPRGGTDEPLFVFDATVWETKGFNGFAPDNEVAARVTRCVTVLVDEFTVAWHEANPRDPAPEGE